MEEQQRIVRLVEESNAALATQEACMQEQATMLYEEIANEGLRVEKGMKGQMQPLRYGLATHEQATGRLQESIQAHVETIQQVLVAQEGKASEALATLHKTITGEITQAIQPLCDTLGTQEQVIARLQEETRQAIDTLRVELRRRQDEELEKLRQELNAAIEYRASNIDKAIQTLERDVARDNADFTQKLVGYDQQFEQVRMNIDANRSIVLGSQKRADHQDEQLADFKRQLQEEAQARQSFAERFEVLMVALAEKRKAKTRKKEE